MSHDWIIAGGGSAGSVLAARLSEDPECQVLLLEAGRTGPLDTDADLLSNINFALTARDWGFRALISGERELDYPQGKFLGGGSSVNGGLAIRGAPADYDRWAAAGNPSWSWSSMLPALERLESDLDFGQAEYHGNGGPIPIQRWSSADLLPVQQAFGHACVEHGLPWTDDHNHPTSTGVGPLPMNRLEGRRMSAAMTYLAPVLDRPNLTVVGDAHVARVRIEGGRAVGVEYLVGSTSQYAEGGQIVLSAGAIGSPAVLWRSGIGPAADLQALGIPCQVANEAVGANLLDHPGLFLFCKPGRSGPDVSKPQFQLGARFTSGPQAPANDMLLSMMNFWDLSESPDFRAQVGVPTVVVLTCGVHQPESRGSVSLASADPTVAPRIRVNLLQERSDTERLVDGLLRCREIAASPAMRDFVAEPVLLSAADFADRAALERYARALVAPWYHPTGTCRMGPQTDPSAVVDDQLRVHGVSGLRVVDASVMPTIPRAPTNLSVIALAERAAELLADGRAP